MKKILEKIKTIKNTGNYENWIDFVETSGTYTHTRWQTYICINNDHGSVFFKWNVHKI